jgi:hypothetical protein
VTGQPSENGPRHHHPLLIQTTMPNDTSSMESQDPSARASRPAKAPDHVATSCATAPGRTRSATLAQRSLIVRGGSMATAGCRPESSRLRYTAGIATGIVRCGFDRWRRQRLWRVGKQLRGIIWHRLVRIDDRVRLRRWRAHATSEPAVPMADRFVGRADGLPPRAADPGFVDGIAAAPAKPGFPMDRRSSGPTSIGGVTAVVLDSTPALVRAVPEGDLVRTGSLRCARLVRAGRRGSPRGRRRVR